MPHRSSDLGAALTGFVVGGTVLFAVMFAIVILTNNHYADMESAPAGQAPAAQTGAGH
jgi:hypothetical protein